MPKKATDTTADQPDQVADTSTDTQASETEAQTDAQSASGDPVSGEQTADQVPEQSAEVERLTARVAELEALVPAEGAVVLDATAAAAYNALTALNLTAEQVQEAISTRDRLQGELTTYVMREAATIAGWDPDAFVEVATDKRLQVEVREASKDGVTTRAPFVVLPSGAAQDLAAYVQANHPKYIPALETTAKERGVEWPEQAAGGKPPVVDPVKKLTGSFVLPSQRKSS